METIIIILMRVERGKKVKLVKSHAKLRIKRHD